jgi:hypothetical protein
MASAGRRTTVADGQLTRELHRRDLSGVHLAALAALLHDVGAPVWASGPTAAALHGFDGFVLRPPFHVVLPRGRNVRRIGHVVHTTESIELIDRSHVEGLPVLAATRTLIDISGMVTAARLTAALDSALRDGLASEAFLHRRIAELRTSGRYGIPRLLEVIEGSEIGRGAHSWLEREFLRLIAAAGLPPPRSQQVLGRRGSSLIRVDFRFEGTPVVVETLGYRWHRTGAQMRIDAERMNRLQLDGFIVLQFTYDDVVRHGAAVVALVAEALRPYLAERFV